MRPRSITVTLHPDAADRLALTFCRLLAASGVRYAIVSGYVAILLGRNRLSEDIDLFTEPLSAARFARLHKALTRSLECITPGGIAVLHGDYLDAGRESTSIRYARRGTFSPNVELKFAFKPHQLYSIKRRLPVNVNGQRLYIGALEMNIAYKLMMGTEKDLADARWIYDRTHGVLDRVELKGLMEGFGVKAEWAK